MIDIEDALLMRAEFCGGYIGIAEYEEANSELMRSDVIVNTMARFVSYWSNWEVAMWQSLLTREIILSGGL